MSTQLVYRSISGLTTLIHSPVVNPKFRKKLYTAAKSKLI